jgi:hypothetical protein
VTISGGPNNDSSMDRPTGSPIVRDERRLAIGVMFDANNPMKNVLCLAIVASTFRGGGAVVPAAVVKTRPEMKPEVVVSAK